MSKKLSGLISSICSIILLLFFDVVIYKLINFAGININNYSQTIINIISLVLKLILCIIIYFIYKKEFKRNRRSNNVFKMLLILFFLVILLTFLMYGINYIIEYVASIFKVEIISNDFYNIFNKKIDFNIAIKIISDYIITPYLYVSVIILSMNKITRRNDIFILFSGLLASIIYSLSLNGTLLFLIFNSINIFVLYGIFAFCYRKFNSIWFVIALYSFYLVSSVLILNYFGF